MSELGYTASAGVVGVDGYVITVEADVGLGIPCLHLVGLASGAVAESRDRVRSALGHCGHPIPPRRQIVNLAPADARKDSPGLDLAIACALLVCHAVVPAESLEGMMLWGELGLNGAVRPVAGTLVVADVARRQGYTRLAVASGSAVEASLVPGLEVIPVASLPQLVGHLRGEQPIEFERPGGPATVDSSGSGDEPELDMADVRGLTMPRRALELMAAGGHNLLLYGPPGVGKTMLARRAVGLLPALEPDVALEVTRIHSVARGRTRGESHEGGLITTPPVRAPHHTVTPAGLLGGGTPPRPGEVSLAHGGLLFLDELPEFPRACLEGMREPLEDGVVRIVRAAHAVRFPARFQLLATMNPCPCGFLGHPDRACVDSANAVTRYQQRLSGPLLDRIDLVVPVLPTPSAALFGGDGERRVGESTRTIRARVARARAAQARRFAEVGWRLNADIPASGRQLERHCRLEPDAAALLRRVAEARGLSPRAQHRLRRVARTAADLDLTPGADPDAPLTRKNVAEALQLRRLPEGVAP